MVFKVFFNKIKIGKFKFKHLNQKGRGEKMKNFIDEINKRIENKSILKHPFYQDWRSGKLTRAMLKEYAKQYYKHVAAFPQYLSAVHSKINNFEDRRLVIQNLIDEENGNKNHIQLWVNFGKALGLTKEEIRNEAAIETTNAFVNHFKSLTREGSIAEGIAALYAYESQIPKVSEEKIHGLLNFYGVDSEQGLEYFKVHMQADIEHSKAELALIEKYAIDEETQQKVLGAVNATLDVYWNMLTGIQNLCMRCS